MGDSGSMLLGLLLAAATISLTGNVDPANVPLRLASYVPILLPVAVLLLPSLDLVLAVIRRTRAGQKWSQPDTMHLHHRLLAIGHSHCARGADHVPVDGHPDLRCGLVRVHPGPYGDRHDRCCQASSAAGLTVGVPWLQRRTARRSAQAQVRDSASGV